MGCWGRDVGNVTIKGKDRGLEIVLDEKAPYPGLREELLGKMKEHPSFFKDTDMRVIIRGKFLSHAQREELKRVFAMDFGIRDVLYGDEADMQQKVEEGIREAARRLAAAAAAAEDDGEPDPDLVTVLEADSPSAFILDTIRNGQRIESRGDVVVIGDVNPGAEIIAGGSIAVFGKLRGLAHAGCAGDRENACIAALSLSPKQLRLAGKIVSFSRDRAHQGPEVARLDKDGQVVIRSIGSGRRH